MMSNPMLKKVMGNPMAQRAMANPMVQRGIQRGVNAATAARKRVGLGRRTRPPTAHSVAVGKLMRETSMGLAEASKYVKQHGLAHQ
jgi:hypothetical protein